MRKTLIAIALLFALLACRGAKPPQQYVMCGAEVQTPKVSLSVVNDYAPAEVKDLIAKATTTKCLDTRIQSMQRLQCRGEGWACAQPDPYFWGFANEESTQVLIWDVPGKGTALEYGIPKRQSLRLLICEQLTIKKGLEEARTLLQDLCYADAGEITQSQAFCDKIKSADVKKECEARAGHSANKCDDITNPAIKSKCFSEVALIVKNPEICGRIADAAEQKSCRSAFA